MRPMSVLRKKAGWIRKKNLRYPWVVEDARHHMPQAITTEPVMPKRGEPDPKKGQGQGWSVRFDENLLVTCQLERFPGQGYRWKLTLSSPQPFHLPEDLDRMFEAVSLFLRDEELDHIGEPKDRSRRRAAIVVFYAPLVPDVDEEGYYLHPDENSQFAVIEPEEIDGKKVGGILVP